MKVRQAIKMFLLAGFSFVFLASGIVLAEDTVKSENFSDVDSNHVNWKAISFLKENAIIQGYSDGTFKPSAKINRAEFLKIVMEAAALKKEGSNCYKDVKDEWYAGYVCQATKLKLVSGYGNGLFKPERNINFAEASKIIVTTMNLTSPATVSENWYQQYVTMLEGSSAVPDSIMSFAQDINRGEMAEMVWRIKEKPEYVDTVSYTGIKRRILAAETGGELQKFSSCTELHDYLQDSAKKNNYYDGDIMLMKEAAPGEAEADDFATAPAGEGLGAGEGSVDYSSTNVQVEGVDEADIVKNDGNYIYVLKGNTVRIVRAYPPASLSELSQVTFSDKDFYPSDMYVDDDKLVVIGYSYNSIFDVGDDFATGEEKVSASYSEFMAYPYGGAVTRVYIYDISDRTNVKFYRELSFEGNYSSSRKVDNMVYLVVNKYQINFETEEGKWDEKGIVPLYADSVDGDIDKVTGCSDILYLPAVDSTEYVVVAGIPIDDAGAEISEEVVLGSSGEIYASRDNLYVAEPKYNWYYLNQDSAASKEETIIHKFGLGRADIKYLGKNDVPGTILNQFSMDEYKGYFRIATTLGNLWDEENQAKNNVYVLDNDLKIVGKLEGIAPGEKIYSVRFMGDKTYMVTFKNTDPFFVLDTSEPTAPKILGKLKIPGYSDYLHPYDENHIIGFGKEAVDAGKEESWGEDFAWYQGMKVAMFDVTDVANPVELHKIVIGDRGTSSELLYNHKALLFDKEKGIMAFPVTLAELPESAKNNPDVSDGAYGDFVSQGAYVYDVSVENGFSLKGVISHYAPNEVKDLAGYYWAGDKDVSRILYIGDYLYTVSQAIVKVNVLKTLEELKALVLALP